MAVPGAEGFPGPGCERRHPQGTRRGLGWRRLWQRRLPCDAAVSPQQDSGPQEQDPAGGRKGRQQSRAAVLRLRPHGVCPQPPSWAHPRAKQEAPLWSWCGTPGFPAPSLRKGERDAGQVPGLPTVLRWPHVVVHVDLGGPPGSPEPALLPHAPRGPGRQAHGLTLLPLPEQGN